MILKFWDRFPIFSAFLFHYVCYIIMQTLALWAEFQRGPTLPDLILDRVDVYRNLDWINNLFWIFGIFGFLIYLSFYNKTLLRKYLYIGGVTSIFRGIFICLTSLGPPKGQDPGLVTALMDRGVDFTLLMSQWVPVSILWGGEMNAFYLTQDLMFSGHTSSTFLFVLILRENKKAFYIALGFHILTVIVLLLTHEHYSIDILTAYFVVYSIVSYFEKNNYFPSETLSSS